MSPRERRPLRALPIVGLLVRWHEERLTGRGRFVLWTALCLGVMGLDTRRTKIYALFAAWFALTVMARIAVSGARPRGGLACRLPARAAAGVPVVVRATVVPHGGTPQDLCLTFPRPFKDAEQIAVTPRQVLLTTADRPVEVSVELLPRRRGRYLLRAPSVRTTDPLGLAAGNPVWAADQPLIVYPRYYTLDRFDVPAGRRYQPGGIPLTSSTGDAIEFIGTRDYRDGDPLKNIHWRSWARRGAPVVKEYQEEYFCRIALVLDTFVPKRRRAAHERTFEAAISVLASVADHYSRSEFVVDVLAAGPEIYDVSAGRSLAYLDTILDVLACLEPCREPPFRAIAPPLFERLQRVTTLVAVLQDWDDSREALLRQVHALGTAVHVIVVHDGPTTRPLAGAAAELGPIELLSPQEVARRLALEKARPDPAARPVEVVHA
jgi:uncharacterized protein (DUF58 family)